jgi:hypothetical protein
MKEGEVPSLELTVKVVNVNLHTSGPALENSEDLRGYATFVEKVRRHQEDGKDLKEAVRLATDECINEGILLEFFIKYRNEVYSMFSLVYDEVIAKEVAREEGREEGLEEGLEKGREEGLEKGREEGLEEGLEKGIELKEAILIERMLLKGRSIEVIADDLDVPLERIIEFKNAWSRGA